MNTDDLIQKDIRKIFIKHCEEPDDIEEIDKLEIHTALAFENDLLSLLHKIKDEAKREERDRARVITSISLENAISEWSGSDPSDDLMAEEMETWDRNMDDPELDEMVEANKELYMPLKEDGGKDETT